MASASIAVSLASGLLSSPADAGANSNYQQARKAIYQVFGPYASQAMRVAYCETGGTYSVYAKNGQYLGLFQMGDFARSKYGHGYTALIQAVDAYEYFVDSGKTWGPWSCKP